ncbi:response regulator transcription factor [Chroogloeocystis siderophila]|jgi:DNA-binding response OmpR family regulator|uniref:DNA-binding response regulator n=1 Tax=Chroogloeocystis siderophila 5.2 s.c.1 TaxID=247279 RepID=A0A1U7HZR7_9CHRO|nr:response regulator transcription factor [Chroogloeocystis siderophila]OKH29165.1 DNA-binding response regulator [Chroogloeocystis siderophila 5.2 s.c.1]
MSHILIAEDEPRIASFLEKGLKAAGFTTAIVKDGNEVIVMIQSDRFDLLLLDIGLPGKDGWQVLEELRGLGEQLPIIILSARDDINDKVAGLEGGADDYVTKPFRFEELLARVRLRLRDKHVPKVNEEIVLKVGDITLDLRARKATVGDRLVELPAREFTLAETFLRHPGQILSREQLLNRVWGYNYDPGSNIVDVYVGYLRKKLGNKFIETVRGIGYRLRS